MFKRQSSKVKLTPKPRLSSYPSTYDQLAFHLSIHPSFHYPLIHPHQYNLIHQVAPWLKYDMMYFGQGKWQRCQVSFCSGWTSNEPSGVFGIANTVRLLGSGLLFDNGLPPGPRRSGVNVGKWQTCATDRDRSLAFC